MPPLSSPRPCRGGAGGIALSYTCPARVFGPATFGSPLRAEQTLCQFSACYDQLVKRFIKVRISYDDWVALIGGKDRSSAQQFLDERSTRPFGSSHEHIEVVDGQRQSLTVQLE